MKIQIISDLHLDDYKLRGDVVYYEDIIKPEAKYLFLAGDICTLDCLHLNPFLTFKSIKTIA